MYLPFGLCSAPYIVNQLADALEWVLRHNYGLSNILHILDDFSIAERSHLEYLTSSSTLLRVFMSLHAPVVAAKTFGPSLVLEFMGITLDSTLMEAHLSEDKLTHLRTLLASFKGRRSVHLVDLQSLRFLTLTAMKHNFFVRARYIPGISNNIADALSCFQEARFRAATPMADQDPCTIPPSLMTP